MTTWWKGLHYGAWLGHWHKAAGTLFPSKDSLTTLDEQIHEKVLATTRAWMTGHEPDAPTGQPPETWVIGAEIAPLLEQLTGDLVARPMSTAEARLLEAATWMDRPDLTSLEHVGEDLQTAAQDGIPLPHWSPLGWLPTELAVISEAASISVLDLYDL